MFWWTRLYCCLSFVHLVRPVVAEKSKKIYCGINQTRTINCTVLRANPKYIRYSIHGLLPSVHRRIFSDANDFFYSFEITPTSIDQFRRFNVTANNSIGYDACTYELIHGGKIIKTSSVLYFSLTLTFPLFSQGELLNTVEYRRYDRCECNNDNAFTDEIDSQIDRWLSNKISLSFIEFC